MKLELKEIIETFQEFGAEGDYISTKLGEIVLISASIGASLGLLGFISFREFSVIMNVVSLIISIMFVVLVWTYASIGTTKEEKERVRKKIDAFLGWCIWVSIVLLLYASTKTSENIFMKIAGLVMLILVIFMPFVSMHKGNKEKPKDNQDPKIPKGYNPT
jgi:L-asparagine transporter-like permease